MNEEQIEQKYQRLFGHVPSNIDNRYGYGDPPLVDSLSEIA